MKNSKLKGRILLEMENLIEKSCPKKIITLDFEKLHIAILKNHYDATEVSIDYHRRRITMAILIDGFKYDHNKVNLFLPTMYANFSFRNLCDFLKNCIDYDHKSLAYYAAIIASLKKEETVLIDS